MKHVDIRDEVFVIFKHLLPHKSFLRNRIINSFFLPHFLSFFRLQSPLFLPHHLFLSGVTCKQKFGFTLKALFLYISSNKPSVTNQQMFLKYINKDILISLSAKCLLFTRTEFFPVSTIVFLCDFSH